MVHRERPRSLDGFTQIIGNGRGHILPGIPRSAKNPWGDFVGTWDLPKRIPGNCANVATARTGHGVDRLLHQYDDANKLLSGMTKNNIRLGKGRGLPCIAPSPRILQGSGRRSGANAPGSKMLQDGSPGAKAATPLTKLTPQAGSPLARTPRRSPMQSPVRSPIPNINDVPFYGNRSPSPPVKSPVCARFEGAAAV